MLQLWSNNKSISLDQCSLSKRMNNDLLYCMAPEAIPLNNSKTIYWYITFIGIEMDKKQQQASKNYAKK